jgi:PAS domain S-box-containing protein
MRERVDAGPGRESPAQTGPLSSEIQRRLLDEVRAEIYVVDAGFDLRYANRALLRSRGLDRVPVAREKCYRLFCGSDLPCGGAASSCCGLEQVLTTGKPWRGSGLSGDDAARAFQFVPLTAEPGEQPLIMVSALADASGRAAEEAGALYVQEQMLFSAGPVVIFKWRNATGWPVEYVSRNVTEVLGYSAGELLRGEIEYAQLIIAEHLPRVTREVEEYSAEGVPYFGHEPYRVRRKDGRVIWLADYTAVLRGEDGEITHFIGYVVDISDRKRLEEEQEAAARRLLHTQKLESLGLLAGGIAHDFNNLLTAILGNADLALAQLSPVSPGRDNIQMVIDTGRRAAELTNQMLAYSGKGRFIIEQLDLAQVVEEMGHLLSVSIAKNVVLKYEFAENVPPIEADATQIRQIVMNLITNASEAVADTSGVVAIFIGAMHCDRDYLLSCHNHEELPEGIYSYLDVTDTGCGMNEEIQAKLFDPFFTTKITGRGLGMSAVLGIVRGHHGAIRVHSEPGAGTAIKVLFPASIKEAGEEPVPDGGDSTSEIPEGATIKGRPDSSRSRFAVTSWWRRF